MIKVTNAVHVFEVDGVPTKVGNEGAVVEVNSHPIETNMVVLVVGGKRMKVLADDLRAAVNNATNVARY